MSQVINIFDKSKRHQMIREIGTLYNASCPRCVHCLTLAPGRSPLALMSRAVAPVGVLCV